MMNTQELFNEALNMEPNEKTILIDSLLLSLDNPSMKIDSIWESKIEKRVAAYRAGKLETIPYNGFEDN